MPRPRQTPAPETTPTMARLEALRTAHGLSITGLAQYMGVNPLTLGGWIAGRRGLDQTGAALLALVEALPTMAPALHVQRLEAAHGAPTSTDTPTDRPASAPVADTAQDAPEQPSWLV